MKINLGGMWNLKTYLDDKEYAGSVPGSVYNDLLSANAMEDPFYEDNELSALKMMDGDFEYTRKLDVPREILDCKQVLLRCDGLDTIADIFINDVHIGSADNMHRIWEFDMKDALRLDENMVKVKFSSPTKHIARLYENNPLEGSRDAMKGFSQIRKAHCMYGWDWGPRLPDAGIWRDISIIGIDVARLGGVLISQKHTSEKVSLSFDIETQVVDESKKEGLHYQVIVKDPRGNVITDCMNDDDIDIIDYQLWWPNGYGKQPLYTVIVNLYYNDDVIDSYKHRIGLRTMTMNTGKKGDGENFAHEINGVCIFAMGANYIPEDNIFPRINKESTRKLLEDCVKANFNCVRIWGGGYYPDTYFYDICDELGLIVWQDFMFSCATYQLSDSFKENIIAEIKDNVKRLRNHASLGLWCGNNEMETFTMSEEWSSDPKIKGDYIKIFEYIIPETLKKYDPNTFYWPASPSSGGSFDQPSAPNRGDVHYWDVWHANKPFSDYRNHLFGYVSEFGFQSFPCLKTVNSFAQPKDHNIFSYIMEKHQRNGAANGKIMGYMAQTFLYPTDFEITLYASQLLQAEAIKYGVEHWRRNRGSCMGAIYWQLNDCWPVASWASVDYFGRWKALHYYAKRFFAPIMISCEEEGTLTQLPNINAECTELVKSARISVANETMEEFEGLVKWQLRKNDSSIIQSGEQSVKVDKLSSLWLDKMEFEDADIFTDYLSYQLYQDNKIIGTGSVIFNVPKHFKFINPELEHEINGDIITITSKAYAKSIEIYSNTSDFVLSDNFFDMDAGTIEVKIVEGHCEDVQIRSIFDIK